MWWAWENAHFFHYCDQSAMIYLNWYLRYQTIDYERVSLIILSRSTWLHIKSIFDGTNQWASLHELRKKKLVFIPHAFRLTIVNFIKEFTSRVNKLAHIKIVNKLSLYYWSQWKEFARCAYGVIHAWHFRTLYERVHMWSVWGWQILCKYLIPQHIKSSSTLCL